LAINTPEFDRGINPNNPEAAAAGSVRVGRERVELTTRPHQ
jgi:hypothetical protein